MWSRTRGLLFVALLTGLVFARFARPTAAVMFSDLAVVAPNVRRSPHMRLMIEERDEKS